MDFLTAVVIYLCFCVCIVPLFLFQKRRCVQRLLCPAKLLTKGALFFVPSAVQRLLFAVFQWLLFDRHCLFQVMYILSVLAGHYVLISKVIPVLYTYSTESNHLLITLSCLFCNCLCYTCVCFTDPGTVNPRNLAVYLRVYPYDNVMYNPVECPHCAHIMPARTRHCVRCDHCVFRFEHHCVWTNCCIGGLNYRQFLFFLASILTMGANAAWLCVQMLDAYVKHERLWKASYIDRNGDVYAMDWTAIVQHLLLTFPSVVIMAIMLGVVSFSLLCYLTFHIWLLCTNQTSHEFDFQSTKRVGTHQPSSPSSNRESHNGDGFSINPCLSTHGVRSRFYDRGLMANVCEVFGWQIQNCLRELRHRLPAQMEFKTH